MDLERWINNTLILQAIPAPTLEEAERAGSMLASLRAAGLEQVQQDGLGNVLACLPGGDAAPLLVSAHLDTVFARDTDLSARRTRTRIVGPGVGDNAVALGALLELAHDLRAQPPAGDIWLVANVGEEGLGNLRGMREVVANFGDRIGAYIILEGMAFGHIYHRALPSRRFRISSRTKGGHSWIHRGRASAIHSLVKVGAQLLEIPLPSGRPTSLNIGTIEGGRSINSIADAASMQLDLRSESEPALERIEQAVTQVVQQASDGKRTFELDLIGSRPGGALAAEHPLVQAAADSLIAVGESNLYLEAGSTDASIPLHRGLPAVCVGLTKGGDAHSMSEYIELRPMEQGYQALLELIRRAFALQSAATAPKSSPSN